MQYLNFMSKTIFFSALSIYGSPFINKLPQQQTFLSLLRISSLQLSLHSSLRLKIFLFTLKISFLLFFHNLLFQNMLISLAEKESTQHVLLNI